VARPGRAGPRDLVLPDSRLGAEVVGARREETLHGTRDLAEFVRFLGGTHVPESDEATPSSPTRTGLATMDGDGQWGRDGGSCGLAHRRRTPRRGGPIPRSSHTRRHIVPPGSRSRHWCAPRPTRGETGDPESLSSGGPRARRKSVPGSAAGAKPSGALREKGRRGWHLLSLGEECRDARSVPGSPLRAPHTVHMAAGGHGDLS